MNPKTKCYCGKNQSYSSCCGAIHQDINLALTCEDLMRSRYSAFVRSNLDYLLESWCGKTRDNSKKFKTELLEWSKSIDWLKLEVLDTSKGKESDNKGTVEFKAYYREGGTIECIHENSLFEKENGHWVYVKGI